MPTIGAKSKIFQLRILSEWQWREQNQAIHRGYLYFKSRTIYTQDIYAFELCTTARLAVLWYLI